MIKSSLIFLVLTAFVVLLSSAANEQGKPQTFPENCTLEFEAFKVKFGKKYNATNEPYRKQIFCKNLKRIQDHNANSEFSYKMAISFESDLLPTESLRKLGLDPTLVPNKGRRLFLNKTRTQGGRRKRALPYVNFGYQTGPVKDQGYCGSCWSFSTIATTTAFAFRKTGKSLILSEQDIIDCNIDRKGCDGANIFTGFDYIFDNGIPTQDTYPYRQSQKTCKRPNPKIPPVFKYDNYCYEIIGNDSLFKEFLDKYGPLSIAISFSGDLPNYSSGIFDNPNGCGTQVDHAVSLVGYGTDPEKNIDYWIIKNSWGSRWGEKGYFRIKANVNMCRINYVGVVPCDDAPDEWSF